MTRRWPLHRSLRRFAAIDHDMPYGQALDSAIALVRGKWAAAILLALAAGPLRAGDLLDEVNDNHPRADNDQPLSYKVLNDTLKPLVDAQLVVKRRERRDFAAKSWYELTTHGKTLLVASRSLVQWYREYQAELTADDTAGKGGQPAAMPSAEQQRDVSTAPAQADVGLHHGRAGGGSSAARPAPTSRFAIVPAIRASRRRRWAGDGTTADPASPPAWPCTDNNHHGLSDWDVTAQAT